MDNGGTLRVDNWPLPVRTGCGLMVCALSLAFAGCVSPFRAPLPDPFAACDPAIPREQARTSLPAYRVMPPDILLVDAVYNVRGADTRLRSGDQITVRLLKGLPLDIGEETPGNLLQLAAKQPELQAKILNGPYQVESDGSVDLGAVYGKVLVGGLTVDEAKGTIEKYLHDSGGLRDPKLSVVLTDMTGRQVVAGQHLVRPDGTVGLGIYGEVYVAGLTLPEVRQSVETHLSQYLNNPVVSVDVMAYNSKVYYIIADGGGYGQQIVRLCPETGGRPQILCVNWRSITADGVATTNYQLLPGDRVYVQADDLIATDNFLAKVIAPVNRVLGSMLLGLSVAEGFQSLKNGTSSGAGTF